MHKHLLERFAKWFASTAGVWQTTAIVLLWWILESTGVIHDDQHFQLLVVLTIYSAITQPVLAFANRQDTEQGDKILTELRAIAERIEAKEDEELSAIAELVQNKPSKEN